MILSPASKNESSTGTNSPGLEENKSSTSDAISVDFKATMRKNPVKKCIAPENKLT